MEHLTSDLKEELQNIWTQNLLTFTTAYAIDYYKSSLLMNDADMNLHRHRNYDNSSYCMFFFPDISALFTGILS